MPSALSNAGLFLITTLFDLYLIVLMLRIILVWVHADFSNPLSQFTIKLTNPLITPLRKIIPNYFGIEFSTLLIVYLIEVIKFSITYLLTLGAITSFVSVFILAGVDIIKLIFNIFFYAILFQAILSWVQPGASPISFVLAQMTAPILRPIRRVVPLVGGFDLSPIVAMILIQTILIALMQIALS